jgi:hypothetical protein
VRVIAGCWCGCGNTGTALADAGSGLVGWRHLTPVCAWCAGGRRTLRLPEFAARLDGPVRVESPSGVVEAPSGISGTGAPDIPDISDMPAMPAMHSPPGTPSTPGTPPPQESPYAVLSAEIALLHARLDDLQSRLDR